MNSTQQSVFLQTICEGSYTLPKWVGNFDACRQQGEAASAQCIHRDKNPYANNTGEHECWDTGWTEHLNELCPPK